MGLYNNRIVVKVGTSTLTNDAGKSDLRTTDRLVCVLSDIQNMGYEVVLVSSGAIAVGRNKLNMTAKPDSMRMKQAAAAVGQCELMHIYDDMFSKYSITVAQILLTKTIVQNPERRQHVQNTIERLLQLGVIPILNENDTVAIDELELEIGENDSLSAVIATVADADLLVILSDIDGLFSADPRVHQDAEVVPLVSAIDDSILQMAGGAGSTLGTGGMATKLNAAQIATENGIDMVIMNGKNPDLLYDLFDNKQVGTLFLAKNGKGVTA